MDGDDVPLEMTTSNQWGSWTMARLDDGWCAALDRNTLLCRIYERRPMICRQFQVGESDCIEERSSLAHEITGH